VAPADRLDLPPKPADPQALARLRAAMSRGCALVRSAEGLLQTSRTLVELEAAASMTSGLKSALVTAGLIARAALAREESRGAHYRSDHPLTLDEAVHSELRRSS
jgi:L-aspartate oxidase